MPGSHPESLREFAIFPRFSDELKRLAELAEPEKWNYKNTPTTFECPILYNYLQRTYTRVAEQRAAPGRGGTPAVPANGSATTLDASGTRETFGAQ